MNAFFLKRLGLWSAMLFIFTLTAAAQDKDWQPVSTADLSMKTSVVEPNADAEAIFWEVRVDDQSSSELSLKHYVRVKIFTDKGRDDFAKRDITFVKGTKVKDVEARVTKPDGTVVLLKKEDVLEREIVKGNGIKVKAKSFALPGLETGSIVEFRYREVLDDAAANMRLIFQRDIPVRTITYYVRPFQGTMSMYYYPFNTPNDVKFEKDKDSFHRVTMRNVPAFREEPYMVPEDEARSWMAIYYDTQLAANSRDYWVTYAKRLHETTKGSFKPSSEIKAETARIIAGAQDDDEKLKRIYEYVKKEIRNLSYEPNASEDELKRARSSKSANDVFKLKYGTASDIDTLFASMAIAAGYDARLAISGSRNELFFDPRVANFRLMANSSSIAVLVGNEWRLFSPASRFTPYGRLSWYEEGEQALITDSSKPVMVRTKLASANVSKTFRSGRFTLSEDGTLEGDGLIQYTGHASSSQKLKNYSASASERESMLTNLLKQYFGSNLVVVSSSIENENDPEKPFTYRFKIKVPGYATRTGRRLFFRPNVFESMSQPAFTAQERKHDIFISYPWAVSDDIRINFPKGFSLENADAPTDLRDGQNIVKNEIRIGVAKDGSYLKYDREFSFGTPDHVRFPVSAYPAIKQFFSQAHQADQHQLTLRSNPPNAAETTGKAAAAPEN